MNRIVKRDRRFSRYSRAFKRRAWTVITDYKGAEINPVKSTPDWLRERWEVDKSPLGYATFYGFTKKESLLVIALVKGAKATLCINRWGDVSGYKLATQVRVKQWKKK